jgi:hypothetical protein
MEGVAAAGLVGLRFNTIGGVSDERLQIAHGQSGGDGVRCTQIAAENRISPDAIGIMNSKGVGVHL